MKINLRSLALADWQYFAKWWRDKELIDLTSGDHGPLSDEEIKEQTQEMINDTNSYHWMIKADDRIVGHVNLNRLDNEKTEMQIVIGEKEYWGKGIGQEASREVLRKAKDLNYQKIYIEVRPENTRAIRLYEKLGFRKLGHKKHPHNPNLPKVIMMEKEI